MIRKHVKVETARWYYHCDRLGMIVWQDMVNGGTYNAPFMTWLPALFPKFKLHTSDRIHPLFGRKMYMAEKNSSVNAKKLSLP